MAATAASMEVPAGAVVYDINAQADELIKDYVTYSVGTGFIPVPIVDVIGLVGLQLKMVHSLSKLYNVPFSERRVRSILYSLIGSIIPAAGVGILASAVKFIPLIGQAAGGVSMATLAGGCTYAVGRIFANHFEQDGKIEDLDVESAKEDLKSNLEEAKTKAKNITKEA